jgi:y4mF family transcriptional regulator
VKRPKSHHYSRSVTFAFQSEGIGRNITDREHHMTAQELGATVRAARLAQGLRQSQLAAAAGVGLRFLIELERGKETAHLGKTLGVLDALGCRVQISTPPARGARS